MRTRSRFWLLGAMALVAVVGCEDDDDDDVLAPTPVRTFTATLTGANERPNAVSPSGSGTTTWTLNAAENSMSYTITVQNMTSAITNAHIHLGNASIAGAVIVGLPTLPVNNQTVTGTVTTSTTLSLGLSFPSLIALIRNGDAYVNVHTSNNTGGEIRGQLIGQP